VSLQRMSLTIGFLVAIAAQPCLGAGRHHSSASASSSSRHASTSSKSSGGSSKKSSHGKSSHAKGSKGSKATDSQEASSNDDSTTSSSKHSKASKTAKAAKVKPHGQQSIASERVTEIQKALIREHYMSGEASGSWDSETTSAMQKYQADQGWQTKLTPDSRALKKLGLGADYSGAINAHTGNFVDPPSNKTIPKQTVQGFDAGSGASR